MKSTLRALVWMAAGSFAFSTLSYGDDEGVTAIEALCPSSDPTCQEILSIDLPQTPAESTPPPSTPDRATQPQLPAQLPVRARMQVITQRAAIPRRIVHATVQSGPLDHQINFTGETVRGGIARPGESLRRVRIPRTSIRCLDRYFSPVANRIRRASDAPTLTAEEQSQLAVAERDTLNCAFPSAEVREVHRHQNRIIYLGVQGGGLENPGVGQLLSANFVIGVQSITPEHWVSFEGGLGVSSARPSSGSLDSGQMPLLRLQADIEVSTRIGNGWTPAVHYGLTGTMSHSAATWNGGVLASVGMDYLGHDILISAQAARCQFSAEATNVMAAQNSAIVMTCGPTAGVSWTPDHRTAIMARIQALGGIIQETGTPSIRAVLGGALEANMRLGSFFAGAQLRIDQIIDRHAGDRVPNENGPRIQGTATTGVIF